MSEVLTEILRVDPAFDKERFLQQCESDIIPNVLEVGAPPPSWSCRRPGPAASQPPPGLFSQGGVFGAEPGLPSSEA